MQCQADSINKWLQRKLRQIIRVCRGFFVIFFILVILSPPIPWFVMVSPFFLFGKLYFTCNKKNSCWNFLALSCQRCTTRPSITKWPNGLMAWPTPFDWQGRSPIKRVSMRLISSITLQWRVYEIDSRLDVTTSRLHSGQPFAEEEDIWSGKLFCHVKFVPKSGIPWNALKLRSVAQQLLNFFQKILRNAVKVLN